MVKTPTINLSGQFFIEKFIKNSFFFHPVFTLDSSHVHGPGLKTADGIARGEGWHIGVRMPTYARRILK